MLFERKIFVFVPYRYGTLQPFDELIAAGWRVKVTHSYCSSPTGTGRVLQYTVVAARRVRLIGWLRRKLAR